MHRRSMIKKKLKNQKKKKLKKIIDEKKLQTVFIKKEKRQSPVLELSYSIPVIDFS
jgi:hypothetical protein